MAFIPVILCLINLAIFIGVIMNILPFIKLNVYITQVIIGFCIVLYHVITHTWPIDLIILLVLQIIFIHIKHRYLLEERVGIIFIKRLYRFILWAVLFTIACGYISTVPIGFDVVFAWLAMIGLSTLYTFSCFVAFVSAFYSKSDSQIETGVLLVLGAGIFTEEVTHMLAARLDKTIRLWRRNSNRLILVSGGQGPDEPISEALAMQRYLVRNGVAPQSIIMETASTSTFENLYESKRVLKECGLMSQSILCITSHFHIMRALRFAQKLEMPMEGTGCVSPLSFLHMMIVRDFLALMYQYRLLLTIYFALLFFCSIIAMWFIPTH